jgi:hypothetical protein
MSKVFGMVARAGKVEQTPEAKAAKFCYSRGEARSDSSLVHETCGCEDLIEILPEKLDPIAHPDARLLSVVAFL